MKNLFFALSIFAAVPALAQQHPHADAQRQADVAERGADVMPFDLSATMHLFSNTQTGAMAGHDHHHH